MKNPFRRFPTSAQRVRPILWTALSVLGLIAVACSMPVENNAPIQTAGAASQTPWARYSDWPKTDWKSFSTLAHSISSPVASEKVSASIVGDAAKGEKLAFDRSRGGSCVACHVLGPKTPEMPGNVGPDLSELSKLERSDSYLFNYINDPRIYNPDSVMPPWGAHGVFNEAEIKDIVAFLKTLNTPIKFKNELDNPAKRPMPVEDRDNFDPTLNMAMWAVEDAQDLFKSPGPNGQACASCHANPERAFKTWAASMPRWDARAGKVLGVEEFIARHSAAATGHMLPMQSKANTAFAIWLRHLANGQPIKLDISSPGAREAYKRGETLSQRKVGQLNFACVDCHSPERGANHWIRGQWLGEQRGQVPHFPVWRTSRQENWDIRKRFQWCNVAIRANELPPDAKEYGDLELYVISKSEGLPLNAPGIRH